MSSSSPRPSAFSNTGLPAIRAITTPLASSAAPPIPPPALLYAPLAKAVLARRLTRRIFPYSLLAVLVLVAPGLLVLSGSPSANGSSGSESTSWSGYRRAASGSGAGAGGVGNGGGGGSGGGVARWLAVGCVLWVVGVLPVVLVRKAYLTVTHTSAPSPLLLLQKSVTPGPLRTRTLHALQAHVLSALGVLALHLVLDPAVPVFVRSRKHPYTLHPVFLLLVLTQAATAALFVLRAVLRDSWVFPFRRPPPTPLALLLASFPGLVAALALPLLALTGALFLLGVLVPVGRVLPGASPLLRALRLLPPRRSLLRAVPRAYALGVLTGAGWGVGGGIWSWVVGEPLKTTPAIRALVSGISVAATPALAPGVGVGASASVLNTPSSLGRSSAFLNTPSPLGTPSSLFASSSKSSSSFFSPPAPQKAGVATMEAADSLTTIYTHLAYAELLELASDTDPSSVGAKARAEAFDVEGAVWGRLVREALVLVGREYQVLVGRGVAKPPPTPSAAPAPALSLSPPPVPANTPVKATPLRKENIFAPKKGPGSPGARVGAALASGGALEGVVEGLAGEMPEIPISMPVVPSLGAVAASVWTGVKQMGGGALDWRGYVPVWAVRLGEKAVRVSVPRAWTVERKGRAVRGWVPRGEVCVEAIGVLSHLTCASLTEDRFGVVQRDIPRVLEALCAFLGAVEEAVEGLRPAGAGADTQSADTSTDGPEAGAAEVEKTEEQKRKAQELAEEAADLDQAREVLGDVADALKEGIARITRTFGDKLRAFRFAPRTAARLQGFVDYCA
ncbi:nucleoporin protein Ndc1-Nup-domain-containing protein [Mycena crocata]|nr:nucleoporin protein Ndc1-Nup-domain-containing protein [Mycena crocata]